MKNPKEFSIVEGSQESVPLSEKDIVYLERVFKFNKFGPKIGYDKHASPLIKNGSFAGIIQVGNNRINFQQKINSNLFSMMSYSEVEEYLVYDFDKMIPMETGEHFYEILGNMFLRRFKDISRKGFLKKYVSREELSKFVKGKIILEEGLKRGILDKSMIFCRYEDLTYDNLENKIVLYALKTLSKKIKLNSKLKLKIINRMQELENFVSLNDFDILSLNKVSFNSLNFYYKELITLSRFIILKEFIGSRNLKDSSIGFNFPIDMNRLYESFLTKLIQEKINKDFPEWECLPQKTIRTLDKEGKLSIRPDIILRNKKSAKVIIIDAKYKFSDKNADYYQVLSYLLSNKMSLAGCLIYPLSENQKFGNLFFSKNLDEEPISYNLPIFSEEINLDFLNGPNSFQDFKHNLGSQITSVLQKLFLVEESSYL